MTLAQRATALAVYQSWFYKPNPMNGRRAAKRLQALGFVWDGRRWRTPTADMFVECITGRHQVTTSTVHNGRQT